MKRAYLPIVVFAILAVAALGYIGYVQRLKPDEDILDAKHWENQYPQIYQSYIRSTESGYEERFGGEQQIDYIKKYPNIKTLYEGYGFAKEYFSTDSHIHTLDNVRKIGRPKPGGACLVCKTSDYEPLLEKYGDEFFTTEFAKLAEEAQHPVTCYNCHKNNPGTVNVTAPQFAQAAEKLNIKEPAGTTACIQCHVEYYFPSDTKKVILPWDNGFNIEDIEKFYDDLNHADWEHPRTKTKLIKIQHPEYEMYKGSVHYGFGTSCADCHMPTVEGKDNQQYKSHWTGSPYATVEESCLKCHSNLSGEELVKSSQERQQNIEDREKEVSDLLVDLVEELAAAVEANADEQLLEEVRALHRSAQIRWDFIFAENSTGFHNFEKAEEYLNEAQELAEEALQKLEDAGQ